MGRVIKSSRSQSRWRRIAITQRDVRVMELLVERRAEDLDHLHRDAFPRVSRKRALNRLGELCAAGMVVRESVDVPGYGPQSVYTLGPRGRAAIVRRSPAAADALEGRRFNPTLRTASLPHQVVMNRVAERLAFPVVHEHLLPKLGDNRSAARPDGMFQAWSLDRRRPWVWVEVDLGHYSRRRVREKLEGFTKHGEACGLIWVTSTRERAKQVTRWVNTEREDAYHGLLHSRRDEVVVCAIQDLDVDALPETLRGVRGDRSRISEERTRWTSGGNGG